MKRSLDVLEPLTAERLFKKVFQGLYPPNADLAKIRATDANPSNNPQILGGSTRRRRSSRSSRPRRSRPRISCSI